MRRGPANVERILHVGMGEEETAQVEKATSER